MNYEMMLDLVDYGAYCQGIYFFHLFEVNRIHFPHFDLIFISRFCFKHHPTKF